MEGKFKILITGFAYRWYDVYQYRTTKGIMEIKKEGNSFFKWKVGGIPAGAILIK